MAHAAAALLGSGRGRRPRARPSSAVLSVRSRFQPLRRSARGTHPGSYSPHWPLRCRVAGSRTCRKRWWGWRPIPPAGSWSPASAVVLSPLFSLARFFAAGRGNRPAGVLGLLARGAHQRFTQPQALAKVDATGRVRSAQVAVLGSELLLPAARTPPAAALLAQVMREVNFQLFLTQSSASRLCRRQATLSRRRYLALPARVTREPEAMTDHAYPPCTQTKNLGRPRRRPQDQAVSRAGRARYRGLDKVAWRRQRRLAELSVRNN